MKFKKQFSSTRIYFHDDDWKFEDEDGGTEVLPPVLENEDSEGYAPRGASVDFDLEGKAMLSSASSTAAPQIMQRQLSEEAYKMELKFFSRNISSLHPTAWDHDTRVGKLRYRVHQFIDHIAMRLLTLLIVIADIALVLASIFDENNQPTYTVVTLVVVTYFLVEVLLRIFAWGGEFFHHRLEVIDFLVIIITFVITVVVESLRQYEKAKYFRFIIVFRVFRIVFYVKIFYGVWQSVRRAARNLVGQNKQRFVKDGFNLDLTYITQRVIAMSFPSRGLMATYRNPIKEVAKFFNEKHTQHYRIYNLCSERHYDVTHFHNNVERLKIDDHNVPKMTELLQFCKDADEYMKSDAKNVIAIHCKGGKGRTGTCVAGYLLYSGQIKTADKALLYFGQRRTDQHVGVTFQGVETPSQIRYVNYLETVLKDMNGEIPEEKELMLKTLKITGLMEVGDGDGSDITMQIIMNGELFYECPVRGEYRKNKDMVVRKFPFDSTKKIKGDVKFRFLSSNSKVPEDYDDCAFFFWIHTSFVPNLKFFARRHEIGNCHKPKYHDIYQPNFAISLSFFEPTDMATTLSTGLSVSRAAKRWRSFKSKRGKGSEDKYLDDEGGSLPV